MSLEQAKAFLVRVDEDEQVRKAAQAAYTEELLKLARKLGFQVSDEDLKQAIAELSDAGDELSIDQLALVAGGIRTNKPFFEKDSIAMLNQPNLGGSQRR